MGGEVGGWMNRLEGRMDERTDGERKGWPSGFVS